MTTLLTSEQRVKLINNGEFHRAVERLDPDPLLRCDPFPVVKLFTPDANATWLLVELDPSDTDLAFGLCDLGLGEPELGYVRLSELAALRGPLRLPVEQDRYFVPEWPISVYAERARGASRIVT
jgi:hypothetical protein